MWITDAPIEGEATLHSLQEEEERIPDDVYAQISKHHNAIVGHQGVERTMKLLIAAGCPKKKLRQHVTKFIKECDVCQKFDERKNEVKAGRFTTGGKHRPFECINVDTIGHFPADDFGRTYCVVIADTFSRFITLYPVLDNSAMQAVEAILTHCGTFGNPDMILHDGGSEYENLLMDGFCNATGGLHSVTVAHSHEENSIVERANKEVRRWLRALLYEKGKPRKDWSKLLPYVQRIHNSTVVATIGYAPNDIVFGEHVPNTLPIFQHDPDPKERMNKWERYIFEKVKSQNEVLEKVREMTQEHEVKHVQEGPTERTSYNNMDLVLLAWPTSRINPDGRPTKLDVLYRGPYRVHSSKEDIYTLLDLVTGKLLPPKHVSLLKKYYYDKERTVPYTMALRDHPELYLVEKITDFRGKFNQKSTLQFKVKWTGYEQPTWEPWSFVRNTQAMQDFLATKGMKQFAKHLNLVTDMKDLKVTD